MWIKWVKVNSLTQERDSEDHWKKSVLSTICVWSPVGLILGLSFASLSKSDDQNSSQQECALDRKHTVMQDLRHRKWVLYFLESHVRLLAEQYNLAC